MRMGDHTHDGRPCTDGCSARPLPLPTESQLADMMFGAGASEQLAKMPKDIVQGLRDAHTQTAAADTTVQPVAAIPRFNLLAVLLMQGSVVRVLGLYLDDWKRACEHAAAVGGVVILLSPEGSRDYRIEQDGNLSISECEGGSLCEGHPERGDQRSPAGRTGISARKWCGKPLGGFWICAKEPDHEGECSSVTAVPCAEPPPTACRKCDQPFDPSDTRHDGYSQYPGKPYCRFCVDMCDDHEIADHRCVICA